MGELVVVGRVHVQGTVLGKEMGETSENVALGRMNGVVCLKGSRKFFVLSQTWQRRPEGEFVLESPRAAFSLPSPAPPAVGMLPVLRPYCPRRLFPHFPGPRLSSEVG